MLSPGYSCTSSPAGVWAEAPGTAAQTARQSKEGNRMRFDIRVFIIPRMDLVLLWLPAGCATTRIHKKWLPQPIRQGERSETTLRKCLRQVSRHCGRVLISKSKL